jgi:hypothetical protein
MIECVLLTTLCAICEDKPGSDAYVSCGMNIDNQRAAADNVNRAIVGQYLLTHR